MKKVTDIISLEDLTDSLMFDGEVYHKDKERLLDEYKSLSLKQFLSKEATTSVGDYLIIESDEKYTRIVTSPGFSGGYICPDRKLMSRTIGPLLKEFSSESIDLSESNLLRFFEKGPTHRLPLSSIFKGVSRVLPGCVHIFKGKENTNLNIQCYVANYSSESKSFSEAIEGVLSNFKDLDDEITLMYSGGVDSTALYYGLKTVLGEDEFSTATVKRGDVLNSSWKAKQVGSKLGIEMRVIDYGFYPSKKETVTFLEKKLQQEIVSPGNPHWVFHSTQGDDIVLSGQNTDTISTIGMNRAQISLIKHFLASKRGIRRNIKNIQYTSKYIKSDFLKLFCANGIPHLLSDDLEGIPGFKGYIVGMLSTGYPNLTYKKDDLSLKEGTKLIDLIPSRNQQLGIECVDYLYLQNNKNKHLCTFIPGDSSILLPAMQAPSLSYYFGKKRGLTDAISPKREIYKYVERKSGKDYKEVSYDSFSSYQKSLHANEEYQKNMKSRILSRNKCYLDIEDSLVKRLTSDNIVSDLKQKYQSIRKEIDGPMSRSKIKLGHRILNLEMILDEAIGS